MYSADSTLHRSIERVAFSRGGNPQEVDARLSAVSVWIMQMIMSAVNSCLPHQPIV